MRPTGHPMTQPTTRPTSRPTTQPATTTAPVTTAPATAPAANVGEFLTADQIQRLKWAEFLDANATIWPTDRTRRHTTDRTTLSGPIEEMLQVRYRGPVLREFFDRMANTPGITGFTARDDRNRWMRQPMTYQVQQIRKLSGSAFEDRIEIINDPVVFRQFDRVLPTVIDTCSSCHGGSEAPIWRLRTSRPRSDANRYTNFLILNRVRVGKQRLVDRSRPEESLLLQFGLPPAEATRVHPRPIPVMFPGGKNDVRYQTILNWIQTLKMPEPRTGVSLPGYPEPPLPVIGMTSTTSQPSSPEIGTSTQPGNP